VDINAHLDGGVTNRDVVLLALPPQANDWQVIDTKTVDANGDTTFQVLPTGRTAYEADYTGDASTVDSGSDFLVVSVRTAVTGALQGAFKTKNNVAYYHDADTVSYTLHVEPPQPFGWLHVPVQQRTFGAWHDLDGLDVQQNASGDATAVFGPADLGVGRYRVHGTTYQTNDLLPGHSRWARFVIEPDPA
jgi:hypothetical protein